jgi:hypothetical protein
MYLLYEVRLQVPDNSKEWDEDANENQISTMFQTHESVIASQQRSLNRARNMLISTF